MDCKKVLLFSFVCVSGYLSALSHCTEIENSFSPHFTVRGDLLYWIPEVSGLDVNFGSGSSINTTLAGITTVTSTETDVDPSFQWNAGYRIALGWQFDKNNWEVGALWTGFQGYGYKSTNLGKWKVRLKQLDLAALYNTCLSPVSLQPFIGFRGASIFQNLSSQIVTEVIFPGVGTATDTRNFQDHEQFYGIGPLFGLNSNYAVKNGLSFYGNVALGLFYGNYHLHFNDSEVVTSPATPNQIYSTVNKTMQAFDFNLDLALGIQWDHLINNACYLTMKLGIENHQYFNQSRLGYAFGNLSFSGGIFSLGLAF